MKSIEENKEFVLEYLNAMNGVKKTEELVDRYVNDPELKNHILFFDQIFPGYEVYAEELTAESNRVVALCKITGLHQGEFNGIPPTHKEIEVNFAIRYTVENSKITDHWMISDLSSLYQQLGVVAL